ncbi:MAG TPA: peptidyl-prolyl cis-trans isomerase [Thermoanaerobaculia bacterium]|nr:peptidyl-prolyl cis-trans isomerase [Thermoanaerobaculia bacterium]
MKARSLYAALAAFSFAVPALLPSPVFAQGDQTAPVVNKVVLRINDRIATLYDYELRRAEMERELLRGELSLAERRQFAAMLPERVFADIYQEMLLLSRADQLGIVFSEEEVELQLTRLQESHGFADRNEFEAALAQGGLSMRDFREQLRRNMRIQDVVAREVRRRIGIDEELARRYYLDNPDQFTEPRRVQVREVIVLEREDQSAEDRANLAAAIHGELEGGRELADVVATYRDRGLTSDVIDHGWVAFGDLAGELEAAIWDLPPGSFSEPVASRGGLHILEVIDRQEAGLRPFAEVAERVRQEATQRAFLERMATYLDELEESAYIQLDPPPGAEGFRQAAASEMIEELGGEEPEEVEQNEAAPAAEEDGPPVGSGEPESPSAA